MKPRFEPLRHPTFGTVTELFKAIDESVQRGTYPEQEHVKAVSWFLNKALSPGNIIL